MPITLNGDTGITTPTYGGAVTAEYIAPVTSFKNRIINGAMAVWQRGTSFATPANQVFTADRYAIYWGGAAPASVSQVTGTTGYKYALQVTGAASNTTFGIYQRIESANTIDLVGQSVTIQANLFASTAQTFAWSLSYPTVVDNFTSTTTIASGTWSVTTSATVFSATITGLPANAANGLQLVINPNNGGAFTSGTFNITGVQLEKGSTATSFDYRPYGTELALCQRYFQLLDGLVGGSFAGTTIGASVQFKTEMRATPTVALTAALQITYPGVHDKTQSSANVAIQQGNRANARGASLDFGNFSSLTNSVLYSQNVGLSGTVMISAEL